MKLELHLIPESSFGNNLRQQLGDQWSILSKSIRTQHNFSCIYCSWKQSNGLYTHLHEVWQYNDISHIQSLINFECLCPTCHAVHHWGHSIISNKDMNALMKHACKINECSKQQFEEHIEFSFKLWKERSKHQWTLNTSYIDSLKKPLYNF